MLLVRRRGNLKWRVLFGLGGEPTTGGQAFPERAGGCRACESHHRSNRYPGHGGRAICKKGAEGCVTCHHLRSGVSRVEGKLARGCCDAQSKGFAHLLLSTAEMAETRVRAPGVVNDRSEMVISESGHIYLSCCTTGAAVVVPVTL